MNYLDQFSIINKHQVVNPWWMWDILSGCWGLSRLSSVTRHPWETRSAFIYASYTISCSASQPLFLFWIFPLPSLVSSATTKTITAQTNTPSQHLILTCCQVLLLWGVIVSCNQRDKDSFISVIVCLCCSTKSSFALLTDWAAGWRSRLETGCQSGPVSDSSDTTHHTDLQRVRHPLSLLPPCGHSLNWTPSLFTPLCILTRVNSWLFELLSLCCQTGCLFFLPVRSTQYIIETEELHFKQSYTMHSDKHQ